MNATVRSSEVTGTVHRVDVAGAASEEEAVALAQEEIGMEVSPAWTAETDDGFEVVFERGDYL